MFTLTMRYTNTWAWQVVPANEHDIATGAMGGCSTVIILANPNAGNVYQDVVGYHGGGGIETVPFDRLRNLANPVPDSQDTIVAVFHGIDNKSEYERERARRYTKEGLLAAGLGNVYNINYFFNVAEGFIDRGLNTYFQPSEGVIHEQGWL